MDELQGARGLGELFGDVRSADLLHVAAATLRVAAAEAVPLCLTFLRCSVLGKVH